MPLTYPPSGPTYSGDVLTIHRMLKEPALIARRLAELLKQRYIADFILSGRFVAEGGAVTYESGEPIGTGEAPRIVAPGSEYPLVSLGGGVVSTATVDNWGQDTLVTDASIKRLKMNPVNRSLSRLAAQNVMTVDSAAMSLVGSAVTQAVPASALWANASAEQILGDVLKARQVVTGLQLGYDPDAVALDDLTYISVLTKFTAAGILSDSQKRAALEDAAVPEVAGMKWVQTPNGLASTALVVDTEQLGGMADEDQQAPGYVRSREPGTAPVEVKSIREDAEDRYRVRARRVTKPVVTDSGAACKITGVR